MGRRNRPVFSRLLLCAALPFPVSSLPAQTEVGLDVGLFSSYVRALTMTSKPVAQPSAYVSIPVGNASVTVG